MAKATKNGIDFKKFGPLQWSGFGMVFVSIGAALVIVGMGRYYPLDIIALLLSGAIAFFCTFFIYYPKRSDSEDPSHWNSE